MTRSKKEVGELATRRRNELKMDAATVARIAEVDPKTLASLERGERWPRDRSRSRIEEALKWEVGSLEDLRAGREATVMPEEKAATHYPGRGEHVLRMAIIDSVRSLAEVTSIALTHRNFDVLIATSKASSMMTELLLPKEDEDDLETPPQSSASTQGEAQEVLDDEVEGWPFKPNADGGAPGATGGLPPIKP